MLEPGCGGIWARAGQSKSAERQCDRERAETHSSPPSESRFLRLRRQREYPRFLRRRRRGGRAPKIATSSRGDCLRVTHYATAWTANIAPCGSSIARYARRRPDRPSGRSAPARRGRLRPTLPCRRSGRGVLQPRRPTRHLGRQAEDAYFLSRCARGGGTCRSAPCRARPTAPTRTAPRRTGWRPPDPWSRARATRNGRLVAACRDRAPPTRACRLRTWRPAHPGGRGTARPSGCRSASRAPSRRAAARPRRWHRRQGFRCSQASAAGAGIGRQLHHAAERQIAHRPDHVRHGTRPLSRAPARHHAVERHGAGKDRRSSGCTR